MKSMLPRLQERRGGESGITRRRRYRRSQSVGSQRPSERQRSSASKTPKDTTTKPTTEKFRGAGLILLTYDTEPKILLIKGTGNKDQPGKWGFPKGHRDEGEESSEITAVREVHEEIGLEENKDYVIHQPRFMLESYAFRYATVHKDSISKPTIKAKQEIQSVQWVPLSALHHYVKKANMKFKKWVENINRNPEVKARLIELSMEHHEYTS